MSHTSVMLFETAIGRCGIAWGETGIRAVSFPEVNDVATLARLRRRVPGAPETDTAPEPVAGIVEGIRALADGGSPDFDGAPLDMTGVGAFERDVYRLTAAIKPGDTRTYGQLALDLGDISLSRRVGQALGGNPFPIVIPCHRVIGADGAMIGFSAPGGTETKRTLLKIEGAIGPDLFDMIKL